MKLKNILITLLVITLINNVFAQTKDDLRAILHFYITDFETNNPYPHYGWLTDTINPWIIDTTYTENIWQIGKPQKSFFDSAYTTPNAIVTDTLNYYPVNNHSTFQFNVKKPVGQEYRAWTELRLYFYHKYDTDSLYDGGYIDVSYDGGDTFSNIFADSNLSSDSYINPNGYSENDTIIGGTTAFSGNSGGWKETHFHLIWPKESWYILDSIIIRFNFLSDNINDNKEGWLIDKICFQLNDYSYLSINDKPQNTLCYYPNPTKDIINIELKNANIEKIEIFTITGKRLITEKSNRITLKTLKPGAYILHVTDKNHNTYTSKIIKQ